MNPRYLLLVSLLCSCSGRRPGAHSTPTPRRLPSVTVEATTNEHVARPSCDTPLPDEVLGVWERNGGLTILVERCGLYAGPHWISSIQCPLSDTTASLFRWAVREVQRDGFVVFLCGVARQFSWDSEADELRDGAVIFRRSLNPAEREEIEGERFGIEIRNAEDLRWVASQERPPKC